MQGFYVVATLMAHSDFKHLFGGPLLAPGDPPGKGKCSVLASSTSQPLAKHNRFIFTKDCGALGPPTLSIRNKSGRRTGPYKNAVILARGHRRGTLWRPSDDLDASKHLFKEAPQLNDYFF